MRRVRRSVGKDEKGVLIRFRSYNIQNGSNDGLESALLRMSQANMGLIFFQDTKVTSGVYTQGSSRYSIIMTNAPSQHRDGVAVSYCNSPQFTV